MSTFFYISSSSGAENGIDESGLEWTPDVDTSRPPVAILINSSELRAAGFNLKVVFSPVLVTPVRVHP